MTDEKLLKLEAWAGIEIGICLGIRYLRTYSGVLGSI